MKQLKQLKRLLCNFAEEEDAVGVVEIILILVDICTWYRYVYTIFELHNYCFNGYFCIVGEF